jgi:hypothetical protein
MAHFKRVCRYILAAAFLLAVLASLSFAQAPTGNIRGEVSDPSGAVIPGASVKVTDVATGRSMESKTNEAGLYAANLLIPGEYRLRIESPGFKAFEEPVEVRAGSTLHVDVKLEVGAPTTTVEVSVTAGEIRVDTTRQTVDGVITAQQVEQLPLNARNFLDLAILEPGVEVRDGGNIDPTKSRAYRTVGIIGRSGTATRVQVDGIDVTDETVGTTTSNMSDDAVQEFQLSRSSLDMTTSLTSSGAVSIISRSGSNAIHGAGFWYYRNNRMGARLQFLPETANITDPTDKKLAEVGQRFKRTQVGYRAGGPFKKNKLFWFSNWERTYQTEGNIFRTDPIFPAVPYGSNNNCAAGCPAGVPLDIRYVDERLDWNIRSNMRGFYRFNHDMNNSAGSGGSAPNNPFANVDWTNVHALGLDITTGRTSHSLRFGHVVFNNRIVSVEFAGFPFPKTPQGTPYYLSVGAYVLGPNSLAPQATSQTNNQSKYDATVVWRRHTFRYGVEVNRILLGGFANFAGPLSVYGDYSPDIRKAISDRGGDIHNPLEYPLADFDDGPNNGFFTAEGCFKWQHGCHRNTRFAWYAGDTWKARRNLTLSIGTRWEYDDGYFNTVKGIKRPAYLNYWMPGLADPPKMGKDKFGPQLGFAWDPKSNGKTVIRGGFYMAYEMNIYNNLIFDQNALIPTGIGPDLYGSTFMGMPTPNPAGLPITPAAAGVAISSLPGSCQDAASLAALDGGDWSCMWGNPMGQVLGIIGSIDHTLKSAYDSYHFDPSVGASQLETSAGVTYGFLVGGSKFKIPYSNQYNIGFQREIKPGHVLTVDFLYNHGFHLPFLGNDLECRRCASTLNVAKAQAKVNAVLGGLSVDDYIAAHPGVTISKFGLATDGYFQGRTPNPDASYDFLKTKDFLRMRVMSNGGVTAYTGVQIKMTGRLGSHLNIGTHSVIRDANYVASWAIGRAEATAAAGRPEFLTGAPDKLNPQNKIYFGPTALDHLHMASSGIILDIPGGFRLNSIWTFRTSPPGGLGLPAIGIAGSNQLFTTDINGEGTLNDVLPGTTINELSRGINSWSDLNRAITKYNNSGAGQLTPQGQALVKAGIFTADQLKALGAVTPTVPLVATNNPWPYDNLFNTDLGISRPIHLKARESFTIEPWLQIFNLFNHTGYGTYGGLGLPAWGTWSLDYHDAANEDVCGGNCIAALNQSRGRNADTRLIQVGLRVTF